MNAWGVVLLMTCGAAQMPACDLCSVYTAAQARGEVGKGLFGGAAVQFTRMSTLQLDGAEVPNTERQYLDSSIAQVFMGYNFTERCGLQFNLPILHRAYRRPTDDCGIGRGHEGGIGDATLLLNYVPFYREKRNFTFRLGLRGGVKFPTGSSGRLQEEVDELTAMPLPCVVDSGIHGHDLALGSGSVDGIAGVSLFARWRQAFLAAHGEYAFRTRGDFDYRYADDLTWSGGPGWFIFLKDDFTLGLQANFSGENKRRDTFQGMRQDDTAVASVFVGPQINFTWSNKLSADAGLDFPVSRRNTDLQLVPDYRVRGGVTFHF